MTDLASQPKPNWFSRLAHPGSFMAWSRPLVVPLAVATALLFVAGLYVGFFRAPLETENVGSTLPLLYIHVPTAWLSQFVYGAMFVAAFGTLVWRHPLADVAAKAAAPLGATFTVLALFTGSLWGRPTWGTYWEWDARMTSELVLLFLYVGVIALWHAFDDRRLAGRAAGILVLIGVVNLPIIHYSVEWWNTLHQGSTRMQQSIDPAMRSPLRWSIFGFLLLSATLTLMRMRNLILLMEKRRPWVSELILKRGRK